MQKQYLGTIINYKGFKGTLIVSDLVNKNIIMPQGTIIYIGYSEKFTSPYEIIKWDVQQKKAFMVLKNINNETDAKKLKEQGVFIDKSQFDKLIDNKEMLNITIGFVIYDQHDEEVGEVIEYWELPANDVWLVATSEGDLPIPVLEQNIMEFNPEEMKIKYNMMDGLWDLLDGTNDENE